MWTDILVVLAYFAAIFSIGLYMGRRQDSLESYALGNRSLPWWAILASILASEISAATFFGTPEAGFQTLNFTYAQLCIGTILGRAIVGRLFLRPYYQYNVVSIYQYLQERFGTATRRWASMTFLISRVLASGTRLYVAGILLVIAFKSFAGEPSLSRGQEIWIYVGALTLITAATAVYTALGGLKAVVWTDVLQAAILVIAMLTTLGILYFSLEDGWNTVTSALSAAQSASGRQPWALFTAGLTDGGFSENLRSILGSEYTLWSAFLGATFITMATHGTDQDMVQRMLAAKNARTGSRAVILSGLADLPLVLLFLFVGILLFAFYQSKGIPWEAQHTDGVFPSFIVHCLPAGIRGLLFAALFATAMGSLSTALNALATTATKDWYQDIFHPHASPAQQLRAVRLMTPFFAVLLVLVGSVTAYYAVMHGTDGILSVVLGIFGYTYGSLLGIFLLGMLTRTRGNDFGNCAAMVCGFLAVAALTDLIPAADWLQCEMPKIAFPWRVTIGTLVTFLVGVCFRSPHIASTSHKNEPL
ncbi:MAG: sodium:solute symporter [Akkermansia sp.]|nr:sodium:solute symporter [Akkermansia sp.]